MIKARIPLMIQDHRVVYDENLSRVTEGFDAVEQSLMDGPVCDRLAVIDIDPESGEIVPGARLVSPAGRKLSFYADPAGANIYDYDGQQLYEPSFLQVSTFATVLKTLELFEKGRNYDPDKMTEEEAEIRKYGLLGRKLQWAFDSPQLFIIPRAGKMANAFYNRDSYTLEFFFFPSVKDGQTVYSGLSREIVGHEAGHAIIDAIAPDLLDSYTPDSLAIHEGLADMVALFLSFASTNLTKLILDRSNGSIRKQSHFTNLAEEFAAGRGKGNNLRDFLNKKNLVSRSPHFVNSVDPHDRCEVLTGALYDVLLMLHDSHKKRHALRFANKSQPEFSASGLALVTSSQRLKRVLFRGLDFLPPGENTFADYGRAVVAADRLESHYNYLRQWIAQEFVRRGMAASKNELLKDPLRHTQLSFDQKKIVNELIETRHFVEKHRDLLLIPDQTGYEIASVVEARYVHGTNKQAQAIILKISWTESEDNTFTDPRLLNRRMIKLGTTLIVDAATQKVISVLSNKRPSEGDQVAAISGRQRAYDRAAHLRSRFIDQLWINGHLKLDEDSLDYNGRPLQNAVSGKTEAGVLVLSGTGKSLHLCE